MAQIITSHSRTKSNGEEPSPVSLILSFHRRKRQRQIASSLWEQRSLMEEGGSSKKCTQTVPLIYLSSFHSCLLLSRSSQRHVVHLIHRSHKRSRTLGHTDASEALRKTPPDLTEGLKFLYGKVQSQGLTHLS